MQHRILHGPADGYEMPDREQVLQPAKSDLDSRADLAETVGMRLRQARSDAGLTQGEVARALGYAPSVISAFESGARRLKVDDLAKLCALLDKTADYFVSGPPSQTARVGVKLRAELADVPHENLSDAVSALLDYAELELSHPAETPDLRDLDPEEAARKVLKLAGITEPPVEIDRISRALDIPVISWALPDALSALLVDTEDGGFVIGVNRWHPQNRQRFSVAHECGHAVLRHSADYFLEFTDLDPFGDEPKPRYKDEREANAFSAALLMDRRWLKKDVQSGIRRPAELAVRYKVSEEAMSFRVKNLGLI